MKQQRLNSAASESINLFVGLIVVLLGLVLFGTLASGIVNKAGIIQFDQNFELAIHSWATPTVTSIMIFFSLLGYQTLWVIGVAGAIFFAVRRHWHYFVFWLITWLGGELLNSALKLIFMRPRPVFSDPLALAANSSFPSGHAMGSTIIYGLLAYFLLKHISRAVGRIAVIVVTIVLVLLIGLSRIYLGVHYFSDVVGGFTFGIVWLSLCITALEAVVYRRMARQTKQPV
jgi:membrane-associated phospholipid phosphatase